MNPEDAWAEIMKLKELLWLRHGCDISALYGDDGEMYCSHCNIDFKRSSAHSLEEAFYRNGQKRFVLEVNLNAQTSETSRKN